MSKKIVHSTDVGPTLGEGLTTLAISGATLNPIFPISTLTDNNTASFTNTVPNTATTATFTATKNATSKAKPLFVDINFGGWPNSGNLTLQSIFTIINNLASNTNIISNTRWFRIHLMNL